MNKLVDIEITGGWNWENNKSDDTDAVSAYCSFHKYMILQQADMDLWRKTLQNNARFSRYLISYGTTQTFYVQTFDISTSLPIL